MRQHRFAVGSVVIVAGLAFLFVSGIRESAARHMTLPTLLGEVDEPSAEGHIQLGGCTVVEGSIQWDSYRHRPRFKAEVICAKCPSKYEGKSYEDHVEAMGSDPS